MQSPRAVIFDMDGLMLDTESISMKAIQQAFRILKLPYEDQWFFDIIGMNGQGANDFLEDKMGAKLPNELDATYIRLYDEQVSRGIELKTGLINLFKFLETNNVRRAVATSTRAEMAKKKLSLTGIDHWFEHVVCGDQVENGKPAPDIYLKAAREIGVSVEECLALEDSDNGARAAFSAGMKVIVVPDLKQPSDFTKLIAHKVCESLDHVCEHLEEINKSNRQMAS